MRGRDAKAVTVCPAATGTGDKDTPPNVRSREGHSPRIPPRRPRPAPEADKPGDGGSALHGLNESNDSSRLSESVEAPKTPRMRTYTANEAKTRFGEFLDRAQREPVQVMRHDRVVGVMVSAEDYQAMRAFYADRLRQTLDESAAAAERAGLSPEALDALLADES